MNVNVYTYILIRYKIWNLNDLNLNIILEYIEFVLTVSIN